MEIGLCFMTPTPLVGLGFFFIRSYHVAVTKMSPGCNGIVTPVAARGWRRQEAHSSLWAPNPSKSLFELCGVGRESHAATALTEGRPMNPAPPIAMVLSLTSRLRLLDARRKVRIGPRSVDHLQSNRRMLTYLILGK